MKLSKKTENLIVKIVTGIIKLFKLALYGIGIYIAVSIVLLPFKLIFDITNKYTNIGIFGFICIVAVLWILLWNAKKAEDEDQAYFDALSPEEQAKRLARTAAYNAKLGEINMREQKRLQENERKRAHNRKVDRANYKGRWLKNGKPNPEFGKAGESWD